MDKHDKTRYVFAQAIKDLIKMTSLDKITVTDIVMRSGMTRQTFYRHFKDKYDLVNWYFEKLVLKSFRKMGNGCSLYEALYLKFEFIKNEHSFFKEAFKSNDYNSLVNYDFNCIYDFYRSIFENKLGHQIDKEFDFFQWHWFLVNGYEETADTFKIKAATYGKAHWMDLGRLWDTGYDHKGGIVTFHFK